MRWISTIVTIGLLSISLLSFDAGMARGGDQMVSLTKPLPLELRYSVGKTLHYRLTRHSDFYTMGGAKFGEHEAVAHFTRTRLDNDSRGRVQERFTWSKFGFGQSMSPTQPARLSYLDEAAGFSLTISVEDENALQKLDFSDLPRTMEGLWFMIMSWDAVTFDGPVRPQQHYDFPDKAMLGARFHDTRDPYDFEFEYPPLVTDSRYSFSGNDHAWVSGITTAKGIPCAIIEFSIAGNLVQMNIDSEPVQVKTAGFEHIWGKTYLSLEDGSIVRGELVAPVANVQDLQMTGQIEPEHHEYLVVQRIYLDLLSPEEYESSLASSE